MRIELDHLSECPNYIHSKDPTLCICEAYDEIRGLEVIEKHLQELFDKYESPELFDWASLTGDFDEDV